MTFEVTYAAGLRDVDSRRFLVSNAGSICRATGGKHLIMSSGARNVMVRLRHRFNSSSSLLSGVCANT